MRDTWGIVTTPRPVALPFTAPMTWLLDPADPPARLRVLRELLDRGDETPEVREARAAVLEHPPVKALFARQKDDGSFGDLNGVDADGGTAWACSWLLQLGVSPRESRLVKAVRALIAARQVTGGNEQPDRPDGAFSFSRRASDVASCVTGDDLAISLTVLGPLEENRRAVLWLLHRQRHDGGWLHCHRWSWRARATSLVPSRALAWPEETDPAIRSCRFGTAQAMRALSTLPFELRDEPVRRALVRAADYFLARGVTGSLERPGEDLALNVRAFNPGLQLLGTPVRQTTDMLALARMLTDLGYGADPRLRPVVQRISSLQEADGRWRCASNEDGMLGPDVQKAGVPSKFVTIDAIALLRRVARSHGVELDLGR